MGSRDPMPFGFVLWALFKIGIVLFLLALIFGLAINIMVKVAFW